MIIIIILRYNKHEHGAQGAKMRMFVDDCGSTKCGAIVIIIYLIS